MWIVTGATGFIGSALVWELNENGVTSIVASDHVSPENRPGPLSRRTYQKFVPADDLPRYLADHAAEVKGVFHMGACSATTEMNVEYLRRNNVEYTQTLWKFCASAKIPFVYASSGACYGDGAAGFDDATDPATFKPLNPYGWSKLNFDIWALQQTEAPPRWYGLRFFNVFGPNEYHKGEMSSVVYKAFRQITTTGRLKLFKSHHPDYADGEQVRDFVYVKDITRWMREMMNTPEIASGIYNMGFGVARTWLDLARATFQALGREVAIDWIDIPAHLRGQYQYFTLAEMRRLRAQRVSDPAWSLERGVTDYVTNHLRPGEVHL